MLAPLNHNGPSGLSPLDQLTHLLSKLPGLGPRSARRAVLLLLKKRAQLLDPLMTALRTAADNVQDCAVCGNLDTHSPCRICTDPRRDASLLCVVEDVADLWALDRANAFRGRYHVLGGNLSALDGRGPEQLRWPQLAERLHDGSVREVVLAMSATVEGQTTAHWLADKLAEFNCSVTRLSHGLPMGGELDYLDEGTLTAALNARR